MDKIFWLFVLTLLPIFELRLTIPLGILSNSIRMPILGTVIGFGLPWQEVFIICVIANILVVLPIFIFLDFFHLEFMKIRIYRSIFNFFLRRVQKRMHELEPQMNKYGYLALAIFVGIPLPVTGAWTGTLIAWLLDLNRKKSFTAIAAGVIIAAVIVTILTLTGIGIANLLVP